ncbi:hypothetical protein G4V39_03875 [Thermosulfuriphilus ammonigenes]|uniref:Uncharacterized protein n=1 Tax=Thermosulfuriphilus ammonigenes TaxID=1936021 RepID=A0A6G7PV80_9BACT|nr:hypothetical protein [Thermosulfuriphilus ammonigenes]MBA2848377.1 hypothetical protein [Thermosulfuriphilus ammonigenes]QIJ71466.1 hypothetical protein G4V39_03875 [Thermosulfuriphilus ammonigenes]
MGQIGSIAHHFHQGARSEYLAQYVLSAFGIAIPVPRPEDAGIDLYCAIGEEVGKRLLIENYFVVQVKSNKNDIIHEPEESVKWILSQKYPFIICVVNKYEGIIELYQTLQLAKFFPEEDIKRLIFSFSPSKEGNFVEQEEDKKEVKILLDRPILKIKIPDIDKKEILSQYKRILKSWIELDQENIDRKNAGINVVIFPPKIITNSEIVQERKLEGNFFKHKLNQIIANKYYENLFFFLAHEIHNAVAQEDQDRFVAISDLCWELIKVLSLKDNYGIRMLQVAINKGSEKLCCDRHLNLYINGKLIRTNGVKIVK